MKEERKWKGAVQLWPSSKTKEKESLKLFVGSHFKYDFSSFSSALHIELYIELLAIIVLWTLFWNNFSIHGVVTGVSILFLPIRFLYFIRKQPLRFPAIHFGFSGFHWLRSIPVKDKGFTRSFNVEMEAQSVIRWLLQVVWPGLWLKFIYLQEVALLCAPALPYMTTESTAHPQRGLSAHLPHVSFPTTKGTFSAVILTRCFSGYLPSWW